MSPEERQANAEGFALMAGLFVVPEGAVAYETGIFTTWFFGTRVGSAISKYAGKASVAVASLFKGKPKPSPSLCFTAGTLIKTIQGKKKIEDIQVGDKVLSKDDKTGKIAYKKVKRLFKREVDKIYTVQVGKEKIETTAEHPFWVKGKGWVKAKDLQKGDLLEDENGVGLPVEKILIKIEKTTVYNFEVEDFHTYYVSDTGIWVHNTCIDGLYGFDKGITSDEIRQINKKFGGSSELNGNIESALENAARYDGFWEKTAAVTRSIVANHTFDNGNKRTAQAVINELQKRNGISTGVSDSAMKDVIYKISTGKLREVSDIAEALRGF